MNATGRVARDPGCACGVDDAVGAGGELTGAFEANASVGAGDEVGEGRSEIDRLGITE